MLRGKALKDYEDGENLTFRRGDEIEIIRLGDTWCKGRSKGKVGKFPRDLVRVSNRDSLMVRNIEDPSTPGFAPSPSLDDIRARRRKSTLQGGGGEEEEEQQGRRRTSVVSKKNLKKWSDLYQDLSLVRTNLNRAVVLDKNHDYDEAKKLYESSDTILVNILKELPAKSPAGKKCADLRQACRERSMLLIRANIGNSTMMMKEHYFGMGQQDVLRKLWLAAGSKAFFVHYGVRKLRHGRLQSRVLEFNFMIHRLDNLKDGEVARSFEFSEIKSVSMETIDLKAGVKEVGVCVSWHSTDKKPYVLLMDNDRDRDSICELLEQIRRSCVTTRTLRCRIKRLRLFEGKLEVRAKGISSTGGLNSLMRTLSLSSLTGGVKYEWQSIWAVLYEGVIHCFQTMVDGNSKPILVIPIGGERIISYAEENENYQGPSLPCAFATDRYVFRAPSKVSARHWVQALSVSASLTPNMVDRMIETRDTGRIARQALELDLFEFGFTKHASFVGTRLLRRLARVCFPKTNNHVVEEGKEKEEEEEETEETPDRRWRNIGFQTSSPLTFLLHPSTRSPPSIEPYRPLYKRLPLLTLALMVRFGETYPKMMKAFASKLPPPPNYTTFNFFETCQELLDEISNLLALTPSCRTRSVATERARSHSEQRKRNLTRPDASGFIASDAFDMMLGAHVQHSRKGKDEDSDDEDIMLEDRPEVQYFLDYCVCGLQIILQDLSPERISEAVSVRVRTTPQEAVGRIREGMVSQPRIIGDLLRNVRKSVMILASTPPCPPSPKRSMGL